MENLALELNLSLDAPSGNVHGEDSLFIIGYDAISGLIVLSKFLSASISLTTTAALSSLYDSLTPGKNLKRETRDTKKKRRSMILRMRKSLKV